jgi:hypothetical protein
MTDEKEDKRDFFSKMDTVQKVFFVIAICIVCLIPAIMLLVYINIKKTNQVNKIRSENNFKGCLPLLKRLDYKVYNSNNLEKCSCYSTNDANDIFGCTNNTPEMFKRLK